MQISDANNLYKLKDNTFIGTLPKLTNSQINFNGKNNLLVCEEDVSLVNSRIDFNLDNSILYLSANNHNYCVNISINNNNACYIGKHNYFNGRLTIVLSESKNVVIGGGCIFAEIHGAVRRFWDASAVVVNMGVAPIPFLHVLYIVAYVQHHLICYQALLY